MNSALLRLKTARHVVERVLGAVGPTREGGPESSADVEWRSRTLRLGLRTKGAGP